MGDSGETERQTIETGREREILRDRDIASHLAKNRGRPEDAQGLPEAKTTTEWLEWVGADGGGEAGGGSSSLSAYQLERKVENVVLKTIQTYRAHPEETAAEESWDYVQFQVCESPTHQDPSL